MKIKVIIEGGFTDDGDIFEFDDQRTVSDERGEYFCRAGWVEDMSGQVATKKPNRNDVVLKVNNNIHETTAEIK